MAVVTTLHPQNPDESLLCAAHIRYSSIMRNHEARSLIDALKSDQATMTRHAIQARWSRSALRAAVRSGDVTRILPEHYAASEHAESTLARAHAATSWVGHGSVLLGVGAASAWELCESPLAIVVSAPLGMSRAVPPWLTLSRTSETHPSAAWHGCAVALPALSIVTAYGHLARERADAMVYSAMQRGLTTPAEVIAVSATLTRAKGRHRLMSTIAAVGAGSESYLETIGLRSVFHTKEFAGFVRQHRMRVNGASYRLDMYHPATRTAVELDGEAGHDGTENRSRDVRRDVTLASVGIQTLRFTYRDLTTRARWCREMTRHTLAQRSAT